MPDLNARHDHCLGANPHIASYDGITRRLEGINGFRKGRLLTHIKKRKRRNPVVSVALIKDRETGNSKGFAFVEMSTQVEVEKAISMFNGFNLDDRELNVNPAKPRETRQSGFDRRRRF